MRRRGRDAWELRVYRGIDADTQRQRWLTKTVHGTERFARAQLEDLVAEAGRARIRAGTLADLLDQWIGAASPGWSVSTVSHTRPIVECHLTSPARSCTRLSSGRIWKSSSVITKPSLCDPAK